MPTTHPPVDQSTAIALLQQQQVQSDNTLREIQRSVTEGFATANVKMDRVNELALGMAQMQSRLEIQSEGLMRAFATIDDVKRDADTRELEHDKHHITHAQDIDQRFNQRDSLRAKYIESHADAHMAINKDLSVARGVVIGITFVGGLMMGMLAWNVSQWVTTTQQLQDTVNKIQIDNARQPKAP